MTGTGESGNTLLLPFEVVHPGFLIAVGNVERLEVSRSPLVRDDDSMYEPVQRFIADHGLVLLDQETFDDDHWAYREVEASVYVPPAVRKGVLAGTATSLPWFVWFAALKGAA